VSGERVGSRKVFEMVLIAAHACLIVIVVVEAAAMLVALRREVREDTAPRIRPCLGFSSPVVGIGGIRFDEDQAPSYFDRKA